MLHGHFVFVCVCAQHYNIFPVGATTLLAHSRHCGSGAKICEHVHVLQ